MEGDYRGENRILKDSINQTITSLKSIVLHIKLAVGDLHKFFDQIKIANQFLFTNTSGQNRSIANINRNLEKIEAQTNQNAADAQNAVDLSHEAKELISAGNDQMKEMKEAITNIKSSSNDIAKILKIINEISYQTNLLSLNAAVEAARAGKYGSGFAVVADEIRVLAEKSTVAAKKTNIIIETSKNEIENGVRVAILMEKSLEQIVNIIENNVKLTTSIASSSNIQTYSLSDTLKELNGIVKNNNQMTHNTEKIVQLSDAINEKINQLQNIVQKFKIIQ